MQVFPIEARVGRTRYELTRTGTSMLLLKRTNKDGITEIYFPDTMILDLAKKVVQANLRYGADLAVARMFHGPEPVMPSILFEEKD